MRRKSKHNSGFTLVELMVVMAIMGVLISISTSYWQRTQGRARDIQAMGDANALMIALIDAYNDQKTIGFPEDTATGWIGAPPFYRLSGGVVALITPGSACNGRDGGWFEATIYNTMGTRYGITPRPYYLFINDNEGVFEKTF